MNKPLWFLDIDGVINSLGWPDAKSGVDPSVYREIEVTTSEDITWPIIYSPAVIDFINEAKAG